MPSKRWKSRGLIMRRTMVVTTFARLRSHCCARCSFPAMQKPLVIRAALCRLNGRVTLTNRASLFRDRAQALHRVLKHSTSASSTHTVLALGSGCKAGPPESGVNVPCKVATNLGNGPGKNYAVTSRKNLLTATGRCSCEADSSCSARGTTDIPFSQPRYVHVSVILRRCQSPRRTMCAHTFEIYAGETLCSIYLVPRRSYQHQSCSNSELHDSVRNGAESYVQSRCSTFNRHRLSMPAAKSRGYCDSLPSQLWESSVPAAMRQQERRVMGGRARRQPWLFTVHVLPARCYERPRTWSHSIHHEQWSRL
jgi:hypothetical protein